MGELSGAVDAMWEYLRADALGYRFRRRITVHGLTLEFYCRPLRLGIEICEGLRPNLKSVAVVEAEKHGIRLLRFLEDDVLCFPTIVIKRISGECRARAKEQK